MLRGRCWDLGGRGAGGLGEGGLGGVGEHVEKSCVDSATPHSVSASEWWGDCMSVGGC